VRTVGRLALLVVLWLLAWGELSLANVISGVAVAAALVVAFPIGAADRDHARVHVASAARLAAYVVAQLVLSNLGMARSILRRRVTSTPGVVVYGLGTPSEIVVTLMTSIIALSPGTMTVDVDDDAATIHVHFFSLDDTDAARAALVRLERLVTAAVRPPSADAAVPPGRSR
jgi:multicomponent Na+:H+ antiporter subunit E